MQRFAIFLGFFQSLREVLAELGVSRKDVVKAVKTFRSKELVGAGGREGAKGDDKSTLAKCSTDLTAKAAAGELDPCVGRDPEVQTALPHPESKKMVQFSEVRLYLVAA